MRHHSLSHVGDDVLVRRVHTLIARDRAITASLLAHLAEVDARRLYAPAGSPSMHAWCVGELRFSDDAAYKRITAARAARRFPVLLARLADGSLHLSAVKLLAAHLTPENCDELIGLAARLPKAELERELGRRAMPMWAAPVAAAGSPLHLEQVPQLAPGPVAQAHIP
jgi:hypothetical protein